MHDAICCPLISAHRGGRHEAPENTVAAFARAAELGFRGAECDVRLSADNVAVVIHDATVDRTTGASGEVHTFTATELGTLDARADFPDWPTRPGIPTFAEVLKVFRSIDYVEVEVKRDNPGRIAKLVPQLISDIDAAGIRDMIKFISFEPDNLRVCHEHAPDIPMALLGDFDTPAEVQTAIDLHCTSIAGDVDHLTQEVVDAAHDAGLDVTCWTVNTAEEFANILPWGVDVITTDRPRLLRSLLEDRQDT